jgi:hypothetical protein
MKQLKSVQEFERNAMEAKRKEAEERDKSYFERLKEAKKRKIVEREEYARQFKERLDRNAETRAKLAKQREEEKRARMTTDDDIQRRLLTISKKREEKIIAARSSMSEGAVRMSQRMEAIKEQEAKRHSDIEAIAKKNQEKLAKAKERRDKQAKLKQLQFRLKQEEAQRNQVHIERQKARQSKEVVRKIDSEIDRIRKFEADRAHIAMERSYKLQKLAARKAEVRDEIVQIGAKDRASVKAVKKLAESFDIDIEAIRERYQKNRPEDEQGKKKKSKKKAVKAE